ncbi:MAG TPA: ABC transporter permease [Anaerolineae bacterium]
MAFSTPASPSVNTAVPTRRYVETSLFRRRLRVFWSSPASRLGFFVAALIVIMALVPTQALPHNPTTPALEFANRPGFWSGDWEFPLGTDFLGRDMLSRAIYASRLTLIINGSAVLLATVLGVLLGLMAGFYGRWVDHVISWFIDVQLAFPVIALAIVIIALVGGGFTGLVIVLATTSWSTTARVVRGQTLSARNELYVEAALAVGVPVRRILLRHILPNVLSTLLAVVTYEISRLVLTESALSFLGLGVAPPDVTWGGMIGDGRSYVYQALWIAVLPGLLIAALVFAFNFVGDGLRDAFDPSTWVKVKYS